MRWAFTALGKLVRAAPAARSEVLALPGGLFRANVWTRKGQSSATFYHPAHAQEWADFTMEDEQ
jgi:hypothetical protein